jgi:death-on-curing protein
LKWKKRANGTSFATEDCSKAHWHAHRTRSFYGEEDVVVLAVRLLAGIAFAHDFEQGNKRTAFEAMWHFLRLNGYDLAIEDSDAWEVPVIDLIERWFTEDEFALAFRPFVVER